MKITVIVPTYRRTQDLARCFAALQKQARPVDEVVIVVRDSDYETWQFLTTFDPELLPLRATTVSIPGVVAAMNAGLDVAQGDIIAFTDDDAAPHTNWLAHIESHFLADDRIAGVGGRDWVYHGKRLEDGVCPVVGQVHWFGRIIGNHHIGVGAPREVDVLKGVNMSFRRAAIQKLHFDRRMLGTGAQVHFEVAFCLSLKRAGWKLIYDPQVGVNHFPAQRFDEDQRHQFNPIAVVNAVHNETLALLEHLSPSQKLVFLFWATFVGTRDAMGFIQWLRFLPSEGLLAGQKLLASWRGRWQGWQTWQG
ncbi:glycosyltransferase family 2 protein [Nostoc sp. UHCC 0870]|uniref:glycosyltransferase family 2 protein n=1 Tax=Nostoc sp. UHCC 0870 TaxID=2914041 RepID=UPI001EE14D15|nr:glycosyltransferase family 2 protein [Nostoc sp. UHCC 0870]UKO99611.1 glycosyltransferase family 2 protein [Nostoc sp. UHCC 0870]